LVGSTPIFVAACLVGAFLVVLTWRDIRENARYVTDILVVFGLLYAVVVANYSVYSFGKVPITHLVGILVFHALFLIFGFAAARGLKTVYAVLLILAAIYILVIMQFAIRFGDVMVDGHLNDLFGVGFWSIYRTTFHQQIGGSLGLAVLAGLGLGWRRATLLTLAALPLVLWFMFYIASRAAMAALGCSLIFLALADLWVRSKRLAITSLAALVVSGAVASGLFLKYAIQDKDVSSIAADAVSRTIREIQSQDPGFRLPIWERTWHRIATEPNRILSGRGIGSFPIDEGVGAPDWLLRKSEGAKHSPHNLHLELLYEIGIPGVLIFTVLTLMPLFFSLKHWGRLSAPERAAIAIYVFFLVTIEISGSFAYSYDFQFFYGLAAGVVALKRWELTKIGAGLMPANASRVLEIEKTAT
jgi:O-antigen ligase